MGENEIEDDVELQRILWACYEYIIRMRSQWSSDVQSYFLLKIFLYMLFSARI